MGEKQHVWNKEYWIGRTKILQVRYNPSKRNMKQWYARTSNDRNVKSPRAYGVRVRVWVYI